MRSSLNNPDENVAFSLRSLVEQGMEHGIIQKHIRTLITYDYVNEGGISIANKYKSPGLEKISDECPITKPVFETIEKEAIDMGMENFKKDIAIIKTELGWSKTEVIKLPSLLW